MLDTTRAPRRRLLARGGLCLAILLSERAGAAEWNLSTQMSVQQTYSDNILLDETDPIDDFYLDLAPGLIVTGKGRRLTLDLAYSPQFLQYLETDSENRLNHRLQANAQAELYRERLFLDANATIQQELIDAQGPSGGDAANPTGNLQTTYTYSLAPYYQGHLGRQAELTIRFENDGVFYSETGDDSIGYRTQVALSSPAAQGALSWGLNAEYERVEYQEGLATRYVTASGSLGYLFSDRWRVDTSLGYEDDDANSLSESSGIYWEASGLWTPTRRTSVRLGMGYRYFGWTPVLEFSHRHKRSAWSASFTREVTSARDERRQAEVYAFEDAFGEPIVPATGERLDVRPNAAAPTAANYISNNFQAGYTLQTRRSTLGATLSYVLREYEGLTQDEVTANVSLFWTRRLSGLTSANLALGWDRTERRGRVGDGAAETNSDDFTFDAGISRTLSAHTSLDLQYRFLDSEDYSENRVTLGLNMSWSD